MSKSSTWLCPRNSPEGPQFHIGQTQRISGVIHAYGGPLSCHLLNKSLVLRVPSRCGRPIAIDLP